jgi:ABC-type amino acid transport substrate-binding protein
VASRFAVALGGEVNLKNLRNARVVAITDSQQYRYLQNIASTQGLKVLGLATMGDCFAALNKAQADFGLLPVLNAYVIMEQTAEKNLSFIGPGMMGDGLGGTVHIALPREDETLRKKVDGALTEIHRDGSYQRIWRQYFPFDFY